MRAVNGTFAPVSRDIINRREANHDRLKFYAQEKKHTGKRGSNADGFYGNVRKGILKKIYDPLSVTKLQCSQSEIKSRMNLVISRINLSAGWKKFIVHLQR